MAKLRDAFAMAYGTLRTGLRDGAYPPGTPLVVKDVAASLKLSSTPVREALAHLAGAGLIEDRSSGSYHAPRLAVSELADLYRLHLAFVVVPRSPLPEPAILAAATLGSFSAPADPINYRAQTERMFSALVAQTQNRAIAADHAKVADRLAWFRLAEPAALRGNTQELSALTTIQSQNPSAAAQIISTYHDRRINAASYILSLSINIRANIE